MFNLKEENNFHYFCTVGSGMENFCITELCMLKETSVIGVIVGKVFFMSNCKPQVLLSLKSIERLFIMVFHCNQFLCKSTKKNAFSNLKTILEKDVKWHLCLKQWLIFQPNELQDSILTGTNTENKVKIIQTTSSCNELQSCHKKICLGINNTVLTFRVSCKSTGIVRKMFGPQSLSQFIGCCVANFCDWRIDLRTPLFEIYVHANEDYFTIGIPVSSRPLSERKYLKHITLRSTICYAMLLCAGSLSNGSIILDPMCGAGTLVAEAAVTFQNITVIGADVDKNQLDKARENIYATSSVVELLCADVTCLPLSDESVNSVVCDLPFGKKFGTPDEVKHLIPLALSEINRILKLNGRIVLLVSEDLKGFLLESVAKLNDVIRISVERKKQKMESSSWETNRNKFSDTCDTKTSCNKELSSSPTLSFHSSNMSDCVAGEWKNKENHSVKLGEIFASICVFEKSVL